MLRTITIDTKELARSMVERTLKHLYLSAEDKQAIAKEIKKDLDEIPSSEYEHIIFKEFNERGDRLGKDLLLTKVLLNDDLDYF